MSFGARLKELRKLNNLTQAELALKLEVTRQAVTKWENDYSIPQIQTLMKLSELFNVSYDYLLTGEERQEEPKEEKHEEEKKKSPNKRGFMIILTSLVVIIALSLTLLFLQGNKDEDVEVGFYLTLDNEDLITNIEEIEEKGYLAAYRYLVSHNNCIIDDTIYLKEGSSSCYLYKIILSNNKFKFKLYKSYDLSEENSSYTIFPNDKFKIEEYKPQLKIEIDSLNKNDEVVDSFKIYLNVFDELKTSNNVYFQNPYNIRVNLRDDSIYYKARIYYMDGSVTDKSYYNEDSICFYYLNNKALKMVNVELVF